ncbi:hypothetical protein [Goodfellowiella coeruleoviolacea]|uniref:Uncharacterized protein n=1 Tax=Goodfellowiella coeruleoviolacea TaxID=334858 RepID=A0AAE3KL31_9PSEU|nr:hypothetical protein [Goodfellowiella coeruleoviolacea]MCP2169969.1 hypothetical protein [Goodfellowiella coeruleoviolacea]
MVKKLFSLVGAAVSAFSAVSGLKSARRDQDRLALLNAIFSIAVAATGAALVLRDWRKDEDR